MDKDKPSRLNERGVTSIQFLLASGLALVVFVVFANVVVVQYGRGAVRSALEQGARAGTVSGVDFCESTAAGVVDGLLGGRMSDSFVVWCQFESGSVVAHGSVLFESWTPLTPDFSVSIDARARVEP